MATLTMPAIGAIQDPATRASLRLAFDRLAALDTELEALAVDIRSAEALQADIAQRLATVETQIRAGG